MDSLLENLVGGGEGGVGGWGHEVQNNSGKGQLKDKNSCTPCYL